MNLCKTMGPAAAIGVFLAAASYVSAAPRTVSPWDDSGTAPPGQAALVTPVGGVASVPGPGVQAGADHILADQCANGGWGWSPHGSCAATYHNITAPIALGLLDAHALTHDGDHLAGAVAGGNYDIADSKYPNGEPRFGSFTAYFMWVLSTRTGNPAYNAYTAQHFFDALAESRYGPGDYDTAGWISLVQAARAGTWINLLPWEFHTLIHAAEALGHPGQDALFLQGLLDGLDTLDNTDPDNVYSDLIGLAGGVRGLAMSKTLWFDPINSPKHAGINGINNLKDLADKLASYQNADGSWYWHSNLPAPLDWDKDTQTSAYAVLALRAADPLVTSDYSAAISAGRAWLLKMQDADGSFFSYPGGSKNTEVEAEALSAVTGPGPKGPIPTVSQWGLIVLAVTLLAFAKVYFGRRRTRTT